MRGRETGSSMARGRLGGNDGTGAEGSFMKGEVEEEVT
jgi:hypothetical protein